MSGHHRHDASYKSLFRSPLMVQHLIRCFCPDPVLDTIDFHTLTPLPSELITRALSKRHLDSAWMVKTHSGQPLCFLIEFQRTPQLHMPLRTCVYSALSYEALLSLGMIAADQNTWPPVICLVLYHGERPWHGSTRLHDRIWKPKRGLLRMAMLQHRHLLLDIHRDVPDNINDLDNLVTMLMRFERSLKPAELPQLLQLLDQKLPDDDNLRDQFALCIGHMVGENSSIALMTHDKLTWKELKMNLAQRMVQWERDFYKQGRIAGLELGREEGLLKGQALLLEQILTLRFGDLGANARKRLDKATPEQLQYWATRLLTAKKLTEVFRG